MWARDKRLSGNPGAAVFLGLRDGRKIALFCAVTINRFFGNICRFNIQTGNPA